MKNIKQWAGIALISITLVAAACSLFLFIDATCSPVSNNFCRQWLAFQWETVLAGALGLTGGIFVITSSREQIQAMQDETAKTLRQAKLHRADEINAPLQLAHDVIEAFWLWLEKTTQYLRVLDDNVTAWTDIIEFERAAGLAEQELGGRCQNIRQIRDQHMATSFNYSVSESITRICDIKDFDPTGHYQHSENANINYARRRLAAISEASTRVADARMEIIRQIARNRVRCGVEY